MIKILNIYIEGHNYKHDLFELIRSFPLEKEIKFVDSMHVENDEYLLTSKLIKNSEEIFTITSLTCNAIVINDFKEKLDDIDIPLYNSRQIEKISIKKGVYESLSSYFDIKLPWGILTGIRPVKLVHRLIDGGITNKAILDILEKEYKFMNSKARLILDVALTQRKHIYPTDKSKFSIYVNIPFCPSKCSYCSFPSFKIGDNKDIVEKYIYTLIYEIDSTKHIFDGKNLNTIYIGGGTPTSLESSQLGRIVKKIRDIFPGKIKEFTVEAGRPDTINREKLEMLKAYGVNRISINPQTFNKRTLERLGREHDLESVKESYLLAKSLNFDIINMDIILGLPGENLKDLENTLNEIKLLDPDNLTVHTLSLKRGSELYENSIESFKQYKNINEMLEMIFMHTKNEGLEPYYLYRQKQILGNLENVGYSKASKECIYNISMMEEKETIFAFGLGAVTKVYTPVGDTIRRIPNFKSLNDYINRISEAVQKKKYINQNIY